MEENNFINTSKALLDFIEASPSPYHVVANLARELEDEGFVKLVENEVWNINPCGRYYCVRSDSSIVAFCIPEKTNFYNFQITAAHSDSPAFKIKENPEMVIDGNYVLLNTEKYGGMLMAPWFDRPLSVAGRVIVREGNAFSKRLVNVDRDLAVIPSLAIHMNREANDGYKYNAQKDTLPLIGEGNSKGIFKSVIADAAQISENNLVSADLYLYNRQPGIIWGADNEFISAPRLDDLMCAYPCMKALIESDSSNEESVRVCAVFDNEEVGSTTKQGADSTFLSDVLSRISFALGMSEEQYKCALASSFMISCDNAHAVHPNYLDKADPTNHPYMNKGIVVKFNANQKYTTDAVSAALFEEICNRADVSYQVYVNRSDIPGGSTLGNISNSHISVNTVDIGLAQLAMHSPFETAGVMDADYLFRAIKEFYETAIMTNANGSFSLE